MSLTAQQIINAALRSVGVISQSQSATSNQENNALEAMKVLLRSWSARGLMVYYINEAETHTLVSGTQSYTIGSGGDIDTTRPVEIISAYVRVSSRDYPLTIISGPEYAEIWDKTNTETPSKLWYNPDYPLGDIYIWPTGSGTLYFDSQKPLTEPSDITSSIQFAPEYDRALRFNLAVDLCPEYGKEVSRTLQMLALQSLRVLKTKNAQLKVKFTKPEILKVAQDRFTIEVC